MPGFLTWTSCAQAPAAWRVDSGALVLATQPVAALSSACGARAERSRSTEPGPSSARRNRWTRVAFDANNTRVPAGRVDVRDVGLELDLTIDAGVDALWLVVDLLQQDFRIECAVDGSVRFRGEPSRPTEGVAFGPLPVGTRFRLCFGYLDGSFFVTVDDRLHFWQRF